jgi:hypothetical protein
MSRFRALLLLGALLLTALAWADDRTMSFNSSVPVVPAPGPVMIDGKVADWDLSAGVWSYNNPTIVAKYSVWTHLMWDAKGVYFLARFADKTPLRNPVMGKDFSNSWKSDCYQARVIFDDKTPDEHQMHVNMFYSATEKKPYLIVHHGGLKQKAPFDATGPNRPDLLERFSPTMEAAGGQIAFRAWDDGKGYDCEAFWPWSYCRLSGKPLEPGQDFVFGIEALWGGHRLADGIKDEKTNRIFMFRARTGWGSALISAKGKLSVTEEQQALHAARLKRFFDFDTHGSIPIAYALPDDREVTIAIDNDKGLRVRNLFGQYPRKAGKLTDLWDGLDDAGKPVAPGKYTAYVVDHKPIDVKLINSVYNQSTPPWTTEDGGKPWGANHGHPASVSCRGDVNLFGFLGVEGATGLAKLDGDARLQWAVTDEVCDVTSDDKLAYTFSRNYAFYKTAVQRYDLTNGRLIPFQDAARSPYMALPVEIGKTPNGCTIALFGGKLYLLVPGQRLFIMDPVTGAIERDVPAGDLRALDERGGKFYGLFTDGTVATLTADAAKEATLFTAPITNPVRFAISQDGAKVAISDTGTNQVKLFTIAGKALGAIGRPNLEKDRPAGKFIETDLIRPLGLDFDVKGQLWITEASMSCRRVTCWSPEGKLVRQLWGAADYGALSCYPIVSDSTRFIAHGIEFLLDPNPNPWERPTAEKALYYHPDLYGHDGLACRGFVYRVKGNDYAVTTPGGLKQSGLIIAKRGNDGAFRTCVRVHYATRKQVDKKWVDVPGTAWTDLNDNSLEETDEVVSGVKGSNAYWSAGWTRPDLTIITDDAWIYPLGGFSRTGVPLYDFRNPARAKNPLSAVPIKSGNGTLVMDAAGNLSNGIVYHTADGRMGAYPNRYGRHDAPAAQRGVLIAPFRTNGVVEGVPGVGSLTALGGDRGEWFLLSMDGLYLSSILQDSKADVTLDETMTGQESFGGFIWKDEKGRTLVQIGSYSYRIMELTGLESCRKTIVPLEITQAQIDEGQKIVEAHRRAVTKEPAEMRIARVGKLPTAPVDPELAADQPLIAGTDTVRVQAEGDPSRWWRAALAHDGKTLAVMYQVADPNPWKNGEGRFTHAFVGGDCVDLKLDLPGRGPIRLLTAPISGQPTVVYSQLMAEQPETPVTYMVGNNPANAVPFAIVRRSAGAVAKVSTGFAGYSVLVTIPLAELGIDPTKAATFPGIAGVIFSNPAGNNRLARLYWFDKATDLVSDVPSEARLDAKRWGPVRFEP